MCCSAVCVGYWHGCSVAVKLLHKKLAKEHYQRRLFEQEVYVSSKLHYPNIAAVCGVTHQFDAPFCSDHGTITGFIVRRH